MPDVPSADCCSIKVNDLKSAYFVFDDLMAGALVAAMRHGLRVHIIVPRPIIASQKRRNSSCTIELRPPKFGAQISEYHPIIFQHKEFTVYGLLVSIGSTNLDKRLGRLNDTANLNIYDKKPTAAQTAQFQIDLTRSPGLIFNS